jgi:nucleoside-diphosphate-sugar epimerase
MLLQTESDLEECLSRPTLLSLRAANELDGDLLVLGMGGKMGPSLVRLARRSLDEAGRKDVRVIGVSRFSSGGLREELERDGIETIACDLLDPAARAELPSAPNVLLMLGHKFSAGEGPERYWAVNVLLPALLAERFKRSKIVCFSTGNVYPFTAADEPLPTEETPTSPVGEYAVTALGRERMIQWVSKQHGTPACLLRLNYAVEPRYGVLVDIAQKILARESVDLTTPLVNIVWQGYANAVALAAFSQCTSPAAILNVTGRETLRVRELATAIGQRLGIEPTFREQEGAKSLLSDASRCHQFFGSPELQTADLLDLTCNWLSRGGRTLGKPTKFQVQDGKF